MCGNVFEVLTCCGCRWLCAAAGENGKGGSVRNRL
jgi:hypothetical protein